MFYIPSEEERVTVEQQTKEYGNGQIAYEKGVPLDKTKSEMWQLGWMNSKEFWEG